MLATFTITLLLLQLTLAMNKFMLLPVIDLIIHPCNLCATLAPRILICKMNSVNFFGEM